MSFLLRCPAETSPDKAGSFLADRCHSLASFLPPQAAVGSLPLPQGWPHLTGQREQYAGASAGKSRYPESQIPRPPPHLCDHRLAEWRGHQNGQRNAWSLLRRLHPRHLRPCHNLRPKRSRRNDGECAKCVNSAV